MHPESHSPPRYGEALLDAQTRLFIRGIPLMNVLETLSALLVVWLYWGLPISQWQLLTWASVMLLLVFTRIVLVHLVQQLQPDAENSQLHRWRWLILASTTSTAMMLGLGAFLFNPTETLFSPDLSQPQIVAAALAVGLTIVAVTSYGAYLPAALCYLAASMLPALALVMLSKSGFHYVFSGQLAVFILFMVLAARRLHSSSLASLQLQFKNQSLIDYLDRARTDAESLNEKLAQEICERKEARLKLQQSKDRLESMVKERTQALEDTNRELSGISQRLQLALDASNICLWDWNLRSGETYNADFDRLLGYPADQFGEHVQDLERFIHEEDYPRVRKAMVEHFKGITPQYHVEYRMRHADGSWRWIEDDGRVVEWSDNGRAVRMIGTRRDVTDDRKAEQQLRLAATVYENASEAIFILDRHFRFLTVNDYFTRITGFNQDEIVGRAVSEVSDASGNQDAYSEITRALLAEGFWQGELTERRKNGESYPEWLQVSAVYDDSNNLTHYVGMFTDLTERREAEERVQFLSNFDRLTGFANRNQFREHLQKALTLGRLNRSKAALLYIDLDRFRPINDTLGHEVGDRLLKTVADRLRNCGIDEQDLARVGGDEFTIIIHSSDHSEIDSMCQKIISTIRRPFHFEQHELLLGASIGISVFPDTSRDVQGMINQADLAVHQAKRAGGNNFQYYSGDMRAASVEQLALETSLRKAIFKKEFIVHYQPKMHLASNRIASVEALVRWQHPTMGLLQPKDFIPLAEETGLISAIGELVLERSCRQGVQWMQDGMGDISISVNLSAHQFRKGNLLEIIDRVLGVTGLPPHLLELELTESVIMEDMDKNIKLLREIRTRGIELSLDDFGTGYSSLSYLKRFPVDTLKIDRSFVMDLDQSPEDAAIVQAIIEMAHNLNMRVVAEGVETQRHLDILRDMGCDSIQGFFLSKPVSDTDVFQLIKNQGRAAI